jgi:hypothetical protein
MGTGPFHQRLQSPLQPARQREIRRDEGMSPIHRGEDEVSAGAQRAKEICDACVTRDGGKRSIPTMFQVRGASSVVDRPVRPQPRSMTCI